jgi:hypothetical protein
MVFPAPLTTTKSKFEKWAISFCVFLVIVTLTELATTKNFDKNTLGALNLNLPITDKDRIRRDNK